ncbi:MAG: N-acetyl-gamma-glutamyl-phosphate reductase [Bacillota bacterium]
MIRASVLGATGYAGAELVRLLSMHNNVHIMHVTSHSVAGSELHAMYPSLRTVRLPALEEYDYNTVTEDSDVIFTSLPHGASNKVIPELFDSGKIVIDLSGDYRYNDAAVYEAWYGQPHSSPGLLAQSVYGMPELHRDSIKSARLIGNPGCYTTCGILPLAPVVANGLIDNSSIIIDAKSGATGAGRSLSNALHFCEVDENIKAYNIAKHRHTSEIEQELSLLAGHTVALSFTPHLLPTKRGILTTVYCTPARPLTRRDVFDCLQSFYGGEPFVEVYEDGLPEVKFVNGSNYCHIGFVLDERVNRLVLVSALDNLIKGAAGQAVQNMNIIFGLEETAGLTALPLYL